MLVCQYLIRQRIGKRLVKVSCDMMGAVILAVAVVMIVMRAQRQPIPQVVPPVNNPASFFTEPEYAAMDHGEMGYFVPARGCLNEDNCIEGSNQDQVGGQPTALCVGATPVGPTPKAIK